MPLIDVSMPSLVFMRYMRAAARVLTDAGKFMLAVGFSSMHKMVRPSGASLLTCLMWEESLFKPMFDKKNHNFEQISIFTKKYIFGLKKGFLQ